MKLARAGPFAFVLAVASAMAPADSRIKSRPADLKLQDRTGRAVRMREYRGRVVVLNFWATWCGPCNDEMPLLVRAEKRYGPRGVVFIAASLDDRETAPRIPAFLARYGVTFPVWRGASANDLAKLRMGNAVPATAFLDRDGRVAARVSGEIRETELRARIDWLLSDRSGPPPAAFVSHMPK